MRNAHFSRTLRISTLALLLGSLAHGESSSAISNRTPVNTLDLHPLTHVVISTTETLTGDGTTLVRRTSPRLAVDRTSKKPVFFKTVVPEFQDAGAGWPGSRKGLGAFYGMEVVYSGPGGDKIHYKIGGAPPSTSTPEAEWKPFVPNTVLNRTVPAGVWYFRIGFGAGTRESANLVIRYHNARLRGADGGPVASIDPSKPLWLLFHGRDSDEGAMRTLRSSFQQGTGGARVLVLDWASGAESNPGWNQPAPSGGYFQPLGRSVASLLNELGVKGGKVGLVGHSWGAAVSYETAKRLGKVANLIALDPSAGGATGYDAGLIDFAAVSRVSTGIKGGNKIDGSLGDEALTDKSDFSLRLFADNHSGDPTDPVFHHVLPLDWCTRTLTSEADSYWAFYKKTILLRSEAIPALPWGEHQEQPGGFDIECYGRTSFDRATSTASFEATRYLMFAKPGGKLTEARASGNTTGNPTWSYKTH